MKKLCVVLALAVAGIFLSGCIVSSVYPFFNAKDVVFEPALMGRWTYFDADKDAEDPHEWIQFEKLGKSRLLMTTAGDETNFFDASFFVIKGKRFLDHQLSSSNSPIDFGYLREHFICSVVLQTNALRLTWLREDWLEELLKTNPKAVRHMVVHDSTDSTQGRVVLTADTDELQKFILKYYGDTNALFEKKYIRVKE